MCGSLWNISKIFLFQSRPFQWLQCSTLAHPRRQIQFYRASKSESKTENFKYFWKDYWISRKGFQVCINYTVSYVLKEAPLKDVFNVWFNYSSKACHLTLIRECVRIIALNMTEILTSEEWLEDWIALDRDQLIEILKSNDLVIPSNSCF